MKHSDIKIGEIYAVHTGYGYRRHGLKFIGTWPMQALEIIETVKGVRTVKMMESLSADSFKPSDKTIEVSTRKIVATWAEKTKYEEDAKQYEQERVKRQQDEIALRDEMVVRLDKILGESAPGPFALTIDLVRRPWFLKLVEMAEKGAEK